MRHSRRGVTVVEVLVVCAVVALLAGILTPVVLQAKESGRIRACVSNEKQLAAALLSYSSDYDGIVPGGALRLDKTVVNIIAWDQAIQPYLRNKSVFHCPDDHTGGNRSYSINDQRYRSGDSDFGDVSGIRLSVIAKAAKTVLLREWHHPDNNLQSGKWVAFIGPDGDIYHRGGEGSVVAFFDGHARYAKSGTLMMDSFYYDPDP